MIDNMSLLHNYPTYYKSHVRTANETSISIIGYGYAHITNNLILENVQYVPKCTSNLISINTLVNSNLYHVNFELKKATL